MNIKHVFVAVAVLMLAACGSSGKTPNPNSVAGQRALQATKATAVEVLPTDEPSPSAGAPTPPLETTEATNNAIAEAAPAYDGFTTQALPYGGLAALQFLILSIATLTHPHGRRVGISLASFALCAAAALLALAYAQPIDLIGFVVVCVMALVAMARVFGQRAGSVQHG